MPPASVCNHPEIIGAQGAAVQSGFAGSPVELLELVVEGSAVELDAAVDAEIGGDVDKTVDENDAVEEVSESEDEDEVELKLKLGELEEVLDWVLGGAETRIAEARTKKSNPATTAT